ncbi:hypothetical protein JTB14_022941 [Gonioctena quinquepunctata]|nr:hypothetical protein JTB14_022941 [Gonioctena quinquepunctata]
MSSKKGLQVLDVTVFHKWGKKKRQVRKNAKVSDFMRGFLLNPIVEVCFKKGKRNLDYKTDFDQEEFISLDFLQKKFNFQSFSRSSTSTWNTDIKKTRNHKSIGTVNADKQVEFL